MNILNTRNKFFICLSLCAFCHSLAFAKSNGFSQKGAQTTSQANNPDGSDASMKASTGSAMVALMNLSSMNIPGAITFGVDAYGKYIDAEPSIIWQAKLKKTQPRSNHWINRQLEPLPLQYSALTPPVFAA